MTFISTSPPVGGETIGVFGVKSRQGSTLIRSLTWRGYQPVPAIDEQEVINLFEHAMISALIITDSVPLSVVHDLCRSIRITNAMTPIVVLLDPSNRDKAVSILDGGADHYAVQPASIDEILHELRAVSRSARSKQYSRFAD